MKDHHNTWMEVAETRRQGEPWHGTANSTHLLSTKRGTNGRPIEHGHGLGYKRIRGTQE